MSTGMDDARELTAAATCTVCMSAQYWENSWLVNQLLDEHAHSSSAVSTPYHRLNRYSQLYLKKYTK